MDILAANHVCIEDIAVRIETGSSFLATIIWNLSPWKVDNISRWKIYCWILCFIVFLGI